MRDLIQGALLFLLVYSPLFAQQENSAGQSPAAETFAARVDTINLVFDDYFWTEATRPEGLAKLERLYDRDLAAGRRDSVTAATLSGLGQFHLAIDGHHNRAERFHRSALELVDSLYAFPHSMRAGYRMYLAELFIQQDPHLSGEILRESIKELQALEVVDHNNIQGNYWNLSRSFTQAGEYQPARDAIELALDDWRTYMPDNPHNGGRLYNQLSRVLLSFERDLPFAVDAAVKALELSRLTRYPVNVAYGLNNLGAAYLAAGEIAAADSIYREMLLFTTENEDLNELRAAAHVDLSETCRQLGQPAAALEHARTALRLKKKYSPVTVHNAYAAVAASQNLLGRPQAALDAANDGVLSMAGDKSVMEDDRRVFSASDVYDFDELVQLLEQRILALTALGRPRSGAQLRLPQFLRRCRQPYLRAAEPNRKRRMAGA